MKHLDEATLQAWLDMPRSGLEPSEIAEIEGHLATCAACSAQLHTLRGSDALVRELLADGVDHDAERPPFEEVVARARTQRGMGQGHARMQRMAWAASIVVAIGVGWMTNELYRGAPPPESLRAPTAPSAASAADLEVRARAENEVASPPVNAAATADDAPVGPAELQEVDAVSGLAGRAQEVERRAVAAAPAQALAADADAGAAAISTDEVAGAVGVQDVAVEARSRAQAPAEPSAVDAFADASGVGQVVIRGVVRDAGGEPLPSVQVYVEGTGAGALSQQDGGYTLLVPTAGSDSVRLDVVASRVGYRQETRELAIGREDSASADFRLEQEHVRLEEVVAAGDVAQVQRSAFGNDERAAGTVLSWEPTTRAEAELQLGRPVALVPGLDVVLVETTDSASRGGGPVVVRVRQALEQDGGFLTLVQGVADADQEVWPVDGNGAVTSRRIGSLLVTGNATVSPDSLLSLLDAIR